MNDVPASDEVGVDWDRSSGAVGGYWGDSVGTAPPVGRVITFATGAPGGIGFELTMGYSDPINGVFYTMAGVMTISSQSAE